MSISYNTRKWAADNKRFAQGLIVLSTVVLFFLGHVLGVLADMLNWDPYALFLIGAGSGVLAWTLAPRRGDTFPIRYTYARQKIAVVVMLTSINVGVGGGAICLERFAEQLEQPYTTSQTFVLQTEAAMAPKLFVETKPARRFDESLAKWFRGGISKRVTKRTRNALKKNLLRKSNTLGKIMGTIAILLLSGLLALLVAMLSCSLSCNGNIALSYIVLIGGLALVILLAAKLLGSLYRKRGNDPLTDY
ncbi:MAG: hypothetical protein AB8F78_18105 [Saprospiraceae bacterium]